VLALFGCGSGSSTTPNPQPTPTPPPVTQPTPSPTPITDLCTDPTPPPLVGMKLNVQVYDGFRKQLDSRPVVDNVDGYCRRVGLSGNFCDTRPEGHPQRAACDALVVGRAKDTTRFGPTWYWNDELCTGDGGEPGCTNHGSNQFLVAARGTGQFLACAADDVPLAEPSTRNTDGGRPCGACELPSLGDSFCK